MRKCALNRKVFAVFILNQEFVIQCNLYVMSTDTHSSEGGKRGSDTLLNSILDSNKKNHRDTTLQRCSSLKAFAHKTNLECCTNQSKSLHATLPASSRSPPVPLPSEYIDGPVRPWIFQEGKKGVGSSWVDPASSLRASSARRSISKYVFPPPPPPPLRRVARAVRRGHHAGDQPSPRGDEPPEHGPRPWGPHPAAEAGGTTHNSRTMGPSCKANRVGSLGLKYRSHEIKKRASKLIQ